MAATYEHTMFVPIRKWKRGAFLRRGGMGEVFIGKNVYTEQIFLVKSVPTSPPRSSELLELQNEAKILKRLSKLNCPNIFPLLGTSTSHSVIHYGGKSTMDVFLEFAMPRGNIAEILWQGGKLRELAAKNFTVQILQTLSFLHKHGIVHGNIRGENIILCEKGIKVYGLGRARHYRKPKESACILRSEDATACVRDAGPSSNLAEPPPRAKDDILAVGLTVCEMITGSRPAMDDHDTDAELYSASLDDTLRDLEGDERLRDMPDCLGFVKCCLKEAQGRGGTAANWTADRLLHHPWIARTRSLSLPQHVSLPDGDGSATSRGSPRVDADAVFFTTASPRIVTLSSGCKDLLCCRSVSHARKFSPRRPEGPRRSPVKVNDGNKMKKSMTDSPR